MKALENKANFTTELNFLNRVSKHWNNRNLPFDPSPAINKVDNLTLYYKLKHELDLLITGYNLAADETLKLVVEETIFKSDDPHYECEVNTYRIEYANGAKTENLSLYSLYVQKQAVQFIDIDKLDFELMTSSMGIAKIPYSGTNEDAVLNLQVDEESKITLDVVYNKPLDNMCFDDEIILVVNLKPIEELKLFKRLYQYSI